MGYEPESGDIQQSMSRAFGLRGSADFNIGSAVSGVIDVSPLAPMPWGPGYRYSCPILTVGDATHTGVNGVLNPSSSRETIIVEAFSTQLIAGATGAIVAGLVTYPNPVFGGPIEADFPPTVNCNPRDGRLFTAQAGGTSSRQLGVSINNVSPAGGIAALYGENAVVAVDYAFRDRGPILIQPNQALLFTPVANTQTWRLNLDLVFLPLLTK